MPFGGTAPVAIGLEQPRFRGRKVAVIVSGGNERTVVDILARYP